MVAPVTGPFTRYPTEPFADCRQQGYRQKMPIDRPLEYHFYRYYGTTKTLSWFTDGSVIIGIPQKEANWSVSMIPNYVNIRNFCYNSAYAKLKAKLGETSGWAENIAQIGAARRMFVGRAVQLGHFVGALRQRRFGDAARILRTPEPSGVSHRKALSQNFLEYEYGLRPLISDIQSSVSTLTDTDHYWRPIRGRASERLTKVTAIGGAFGSNPKYTYYQREMYDATLTITCRARVRVSNPNIFLANQLGLFDLALPWKLIPFSFVVDWFVNVEQVVSSLTDFYGVELHDLHYTEFTRGQYVYFYRQNASYSVGTNEGFTTSKDKEDVTCNREMGLPGPILQVKPFRGFSVERGLQAIALVLSVLGR
jgi:hypothetical protein